MASLSRHICATCRQQLQLSSPSFKPARSITSSLASKRRLHGTTRRGFSASRIPFTQSRSTSSVSPDEVSHFDALASSWWDPYGPSRLLHLMNPLRHSFLQRCRALHPISTPPRTTPGHIDDPAPESRLSYLDIGCGGGIFAESAARLPDTASVVAIDPSSEVLAVAREHARRDPLLSGADGRLTYVNTAIEDLGAHLKQQEQQGRGLQGSDPALARQFDVVSLFEVIEHVPYPSSFLREVLPYVRPGGWLVGSTIARTWASWFTTKLVAEDVVGLVPRGTHDWDKYINPDELRRFFSGLNGEQSAGHGTWGQMVVQEVMYVPGLGWKEVKGVEGIGNYFFAVRREQ